MTGILGLDLSKRNTGWAFYKLGSDKPVLGRWDRLASEYTSRGQTFYKLYEELLGLQSLMKFEKIFAEDMINILPTRKDPQTGEVKSVPTNIESIRVAAGMAATLELFAHTVGIPLLFIHQASWRSHFFKGIKRGEKPDLKLLAIQRTKALLGRRPGTHDEAEAFGVLDYGCELEGITPPWRVEPPLGLLGSAAQ